MPNHTAILAPVNGPRADGSASPPVRALYELALVVVGFSALIVAVTWPLASHPATLAYKPQSSDGQFSVWNVAWVAHALLTDPRHVFDANIFYPHRGTLTYSETNLAAGALGVPAYWATHSAYATHNLVLLASFVLNATGMYYLARHVAENRWAASVAALAFGFTPYLFAHLQHMQLLLAAGLPFSLLAFHRLADRPTAGRGMTVGAVMALQAYACGYYAVFVGLMIGSAAIIVAATRHMRRVQFWTALAAAVATATLGALPLLIAYAQLRRQTGFSRALTEGHRYSVDWREYLASGSYAHSWMLVYLQHWKDVLFPGFVASIGGLAGLAVGWKAGGRFRERATVYGALGILAAWASAGPNGLLYRVLYATVPGFTFLRAPSRFGLIVAFALSVLSALGIGRLLARASRPALLGSLFVGAALLEIWLPLTFSPVPPLDGVYRQLATLPHGAVLELPVYSEQFGFLRARYMVASTAHWKPLVNAYSDYIPPDFSERAEVFGEFPTSRAIAELRSSRVRYVVIHLNDYKREHDLHERLHQFAPYLRRLYADERTLLYELMLP